MKSVFFTISFLIFLQIAFLQGCSDAGFCTMGAVRPYQHRAKHLNLKINALEFTQHFGYTKFGDYLLSYIVDIAYDKWLRRYFFELYEDSFTKRQMANTKFVFDLFTH